MFVIHRGAGMLAPGFECYGGIRVFEGQESEVINGRHFLSRVRSVGTDLFLAFWRLSKPQNKNVKQLDSLKEVSHPRWSAEKRPCVVT